MRNRLRFADTGEILPDIFVGLVNPTPVEELAQRTGRVIEVGAPISATNAADEVFDMIGIDSLIDADREAAKFGGAA